MIPNIIHFIYPVTERTRPWSLVNHLAVVLARKHHPKDKIIIWTNQVPDQHYALFDTASKADAIIQSICLQTEVGGVKIEHPQYMSDVLRLQILYAHGGIYMDTDMLVRMDLNALRRASDTHNRLLLSWENKQKTSICNALMISPPENAFVGAWLDAMPEALKSTTWAHGGVVLPVELSKRDSLIDSRMILNHKIACPLDLSRPWLFDPELREEAMRKVGNAHAVHVFETYWRDTVKHIDYDWMERTPCLFSDIFADVKRWR